MLYLRLIVFPVVAQNNLLLFLLKVREFSTYTMCYMRLIFSRYYYMLGTEILTDDLNAL